MRVTVHWQINQPNSPRADKRQQKWVDEWVEKLCGRAQETEVSVEAAVANQRNRPLFNLHSENRAETSRQSQRPTEDPGGAVCCSRRDAFCCAFQQLLVAFAIVQSVQENHLEVVQSRHHLVVEPRPREAFASDCEFSRVSRPDNEVRWTVWLGPYPSPRKQTGKRAGWQTSPP